MVDPDKAAAEMRHFMIGPDVGGRWIVCDAEGWCGALFLSKDEAVHFAKSECEAAAPATSELRFVSSLDWGAVLAAPPKKVA